LSVSALTRAWQILMKGVDELRGSQRPLASADMVLVRLAYAADMPSPDEALRRLGFGGPPVAAGESQSSALSTGTSRAPASAAQPSRASLAAQSSSGARSAIQPRSEPAARADVAVSKPAVVLPDFAALVALAGEKRDIQLKVALESEVRLVRFDNGRIEFELAPGGSQRLAQTLMQKLQEWTSERWIVSLVAGGGRPTLKEQRDAREQERRFGIEADPLVASVLARFPGAQIIAMRGKDTEPGAGSAPEIIYDDGREPEDE
jgi:DNA polymerase-3 subunit gamma/tau